MTVMDLPSLEELERKVPEESRHLLDHKVGDYHLAEIAKNMIDWQGVITYLGLNEAEENAIQENNRTAEQRRLVYTV